MTFFTTGAQLQAAINALPASKKGGFVSFDAFYYGQQYMSAGKYAGTLSPIEHFVQIGAAQGNKPSAAFDPVYYASKYADLTGKGFDSADLLYHFLQYGLDEGRAPNATLATFDGAAYLAANPDVATYVNANLAQFNGSANNGALAHYVKFGQFDGHIAPAATVGSLTALSQGEDNLFGSSGNDTFTAKIINNANTLQSGDVINGGAGADRLAADVGTSQNFAITAETTSVETVAIRAQAVPSDSNNNNMQNNVQIDAQRMVGVTQWESNNSRADVVVEDVRILNSQITKDITIAMVETDPGHVDFGVYFDQYSLRAQTNSSSTLRLELLDTRSAVLGTAPLLDNPYWGFNFKLDGVSISVTSTDIDAATTYAQLLTAVTAAVSKIPALANFTVSLGNNFTRTDTLSGQSVTGTELVLTNNGSGVVSIDGATGWQTQNGTVPSSSGLHTFMSTVATSTTDLVTSKIILDDVGRGSTGGDLVVGGLSVGDTSSSLGVQRFEIEVRDNSKLETISSTNNTLREVTVKNGLTSSSSFAYVATVKDAGNLTVNGNSGTNGTNITTGATIAAAGEGASLAGTTGQNGFGFSDVRLIDASAMTGMFNFSAEVTTASLAKYMNLKDIQALPAGDNIAFTYTGGTNADNMFIQVDGGVASSRSNILSGREDFTFTANGGTGDDTIQLTLVNGQLGNTDAWYNNQKLNANVFVNGGAGNDTIKTPGAGDVIIDGGDGNDTIYVDNTGTQGASAVSPLAGLTIASPRGVYVFNTANQKNVGLVVGTDYVLATNEERNLADLKSDVSNSTNLYKGKLTVDFMGLTKTVDIDSTGFKTSDLQINQAIKNAINNDATLSKLLVATDGPASTLVVTSLIDGVMANTDLVVTVAAPAAGVITTADVALASAAYGLAVGTTEAALLTYITGTAIAGFNTKGDYVDQLAETGAGGTAANVEIAGANSTSTSDNTITGGLGNDVIVLGTTAGAGTGAVATQMDSSNDTVVYTAAFGNDVIVNFTANTGVAPAFTAGTDVLNFTALGGGTAGFNAALTTDRSINVVTTATANNTAAIVGTLFNANNAAAQTHVYVAVDAATNIGSVYSVADAIGATNAVATLVGTIDLADTTWATLTAANFA